MAFTLSCSGHVINFLYILGRVRSDHWRLVWSNRVVKSWFTCDAWLNHCWTLQPVSRVSPAARMPRFLSWSCRCSRSRISWRGTLNIGDGGRWADVAGVARSSSDDETLPVVVDAAATAPRRVLGVTGGPGLRVAIENLLASSSPVLSDNVIPYLNSGNDNDITIITAQTCCKQHGQKRKNINNTSN